MCHLIQLFITIRKNHQIYNERHCLYIIMFYEGSVCFVTSKNQHSYDGTLYT